MKNLQLFYETFRYLKINDTLKTKTEKKNYMLGYLCCDVQVSGKYRKLLPFVKYSIQRLLSLLFSNS